MMGVGLVEEMTRKCEVRSKSNRINKAPVQGLLISVGDVGS